ncbi:MAG TPA: hypothetical protein VH161_08755, partial [Candidatus Acidoferrales bacterium]|nr:hypothetical protein [Candidatus Acidoferrales bacterium]
MLREGVPELETKGAHVLLKRLTIEVFFISVKQRGTVDAFEHRYAADHSHVSVVFNGAPILPIFFANQRDAAD